MPVKLFLFVAMYCGLFVTHMRMFLSNTKRKKARDMTKKESNAVGDADA